MEDSPLRLHRLLQHGLAAESATAAAVGVGAGGGEREKKTWVLSSSRPVLPPSLSLSL